MRALVCGGRDYSCWAVVANALDLLDHKHGIECIIQGGAGGADALGKRWAEVNERPSLQVDAHWKQLGRRAGPTRNRWMLDFCSPDCVVAFPGGKGTADMVEKARAQGVSVWEVPG